MWILGWDVHALVHQPFSMFDANILYPERKTLAYAENLIGSALFAPPVMWLKGNLVMAVNVVALLSCALCGLGAYVLSRRPGLSVEELLNFPNQSSVQRRQDAGVTFIVVHTDDYPAEKRHSARRTAARLQLLSHARIHGSGRTGVFGACIPRCRKLTCRFAAPHRRDGVRAATVVGASGRRVR